ncbi:MAG: hypothetical protein PSV13_08110 [Lacunisphaera sp.]|nr:hypothetical protein [Lacunisphaera sp.]
MKIVGKGLLVLGGMALTGLLAASPPAWWTQRAVTTGATANDYAAANVGQLKHVAKQAYLEMEAQLPGGAGPEVTALINSWSQPPAQDVERNDFAAVNHGQLKAVAKLFYDRLAQVGDHGHPLAPGQVYPWTTDTTDDTSFAPANIGQVKFLFSFDLYDNDADGMPDNWERLYLGTLGHGPSDDPGNVGRTLQQSFQQGLSPWPAALVSDGLRAWFRADQGVVKDGDNKVSQWTDVSGHGIHVVQLSDPNQQPVFTAGAMNSQPALEYAQSGSALRTPGPVDVLNGGNDLTVIMVAKPGVEQSGYGSMLDFSPNEYALGWNLGPWGSPSNQVRLLWTNAERSEYGNTPLAQMTAGQVQVLSAVKSGTTASTYLNGLVQGTAEGAAGLWAAVEHLGVGCHSSGGSSYIGQIAEVLVYNRALTNNERADIEQALMAKYIDPDSDDDGLLDAWEDQHLGTRIYGPTDDPGNVGRTLQQSFQQGLSPWPAALVSDGLRAWFRADQGVVKDGDNKVSQWTDVSGHGFHVVQLGGVARQPLWQGGAMNSQPVVSFDSSLGGGLATAQPVDVLGDSNDLTVIAVLKPQGEQNYYTGVVHMSPDDYSLSWTFGQWERTGNLFRLGWAGENGRGFTPPAAVGSGAVQILSGVKSGASASSYLNGVSQGTSSDGPADIASPALNLVVGNRSMIGGSGFNGQIAEILVYNRALTPAERAQVEAALMAKYINPDADSDGLPDTWEDQQLGTRTYGPSDDPGAVGRTLLQSYQQNLSPWPAALVSDGLRAWFRADQGVVKDGDNKVSQWTDVSGHGFHVVQTAIPARQPLLVSGALNGQPAVSFDSSAQTQLRAAGPIDLLAGGSDLTVIAVVQPTAEQGYKSTLVDLNYEAYGFKWAQQDGGTNDYYLAASNAPLTAALIGPAVPAVAGQCQVLVTMRSGAEAEGYRNGQLMGTRALADATLYGVVEQWVVGNQVYPYYGFNGQIAEILVYNRALTPAERAQVEAALMAKYINPDADSDGLPDTWEDQQLGTRTYGPSDDPGAVGRTLLQSYELELSPWPAPVVASGLRAWYRADKGVTKDANEKVSQWTDVSGQGFHVVQTANPVRQPLFVSEALNGQPAVQYDDTQKVLLTAGLADVAAGANDTTVIAVVKPHSTPHYAGTIFSWGTDGNYNLGLSAPNTTANQFKLIWRDGMGDTRLSPVLNAAADQAQILSALKDGTEAKTYVNGALQGSGTVPATMGLLPSQLAVGNGTYPYYAFHGQIAEVLVYNRALTSAERQSIEAALMAKYITPPFDPSQISGLRLFLKADTLTAGAAVSLWADQSGLGNNLTQSQGGNQPIMVADALNGKPAVRFTNSSYLRMPNVMSGATTGEVFVVLQLTAPVPGGQTRNLWSLGSGLNSYPNSSGAIIESFGSTTNYLTPPPLQDLTQRHVYNITAQAGEWISRINGRTYRAIASGNMVHFEATPLLGYPGSSINGDIAELIIYDHALTDAERRAVTTYLNERHHLVANAPAVPTALAATAISSTQVSLGWSSALGSAGTVFTVERKTGTRNFASIADVDDGLSYFDATAEPETTYTYRVKARNLAGESGYSNEATATTLAVDATALPMTGMRLWLKADTIATTGRVGTWPDQSGGHGDGLQTVTVEQPLLVADAINGRPAVRFDGSNDYVQFGNILAGATAGEVFVVLKTDTATPTHENGLWSFSGDSYHPLQSKQIRERFATTSVPDGPEPAQPLNQVHLYNVSGQSGSWASWINGSLYQSKTTNTVPAFNTSPRLGYAGSFFGGDIAEIIIYDHTLGAAERETVGRYLNQRHAFVAGAPATPTNLTANAVSATQVSLTWQSSLGGAGTIYTVERRSGAGSYASIAEVADALSYFDATAEPETTYTYRVKARNLAGESGYSNEATATTLAVDATALPMTGMRLWLKADTIATTGRVGTWPDQSGGHGDGLQTVTVEQPLLVADAINGRPAVRFDGSNDYVQFGNILAGATAGEVFVVLKTDTATPTHENGLWSFSGDSYHPLQSKQIRERFATTSVPDGPEPAQPLNQVHLYNVSGQSGSWASWINGSLYQSKTTNTVPGFNISPRLGFGGSFFGGDIAEIIIYDHALSAAERETASRYLNQRHAFVPAPPPAPTTLAATAISGTQVSLSWQSALSAVATVFTIERKSGNGSFAVIAEVSNTRSHLDATAAPDTAYVYRVKARNLAGESDYSNEAMVTTRAAGAPAMALTGIRLWLKADTLIEGAAVANWRDQSGQGNDAFVTAGNPTRIPFMVAGALNGRPAVRFDGYDDYLNLPNFMATATAGEVFVVLQLASPWPGPETRALWYFGSGYNSYPHSSGNITESFGSTVTYNGPPPVQDLTQRHIYNVTAQAGTWTSGFNGQVYRSVASGNVVNFSTAPTLGWAGSTFYGRALNGDIAEIIVYDHVLTEDERDAMGAYLNSRYAILPAAPLAPANLAASAASSSQVNLTWTGVMGTAGTTYELERQQGDGEFSLIATLKDVASYLDVGRTPGATYGYRVRARNYAGISPYSLAAIITLPDTNLAALPLTGLRLWLKADAIPAAGRVIRWPDLSGLANDARASDSGTTRSPLLVASAIDGKPAVRFDGYDDFLNLPNFMASATAGEVFVVLQLASPWPGTESRSLWYFGSGYNSYPQGSGNISESFGSTVTYNGPSPLQDLTQRHVYNVTAQAGTWTSRFNGQAYQSVTSGNVVGFSTAPTLGWPASMVYGRSLNGDIAEIIVYDHALTEAERESVNFYLNRKYHFSPNSFTGLNNFDYDSDGDGISNAQELILGTNPYSRDTDGDGVPDGWEVAHGLNPLVADALADPDGDGLTNLEEYYDNTDPHTPAANEAGASVQLKIHHPSQR